MVQQIDGAVVVYSFHKSNVREAIISDAIAVAIVGVVKEGEITRFRPALIVNAFFALEALVDDLGSGSSALSEVDKLGADGRVASSDKARAIAAKGLAANTHLTLAQHRYALIEDLAKVALVAS